MKTFGVFAVLLLFVVLVFSVSAPSATIHENGLKDCGWPTANEMLAQFTSEWRNPAQNVKLDIYAVTPDITWADTGCQYSYTTVWVTGPAMMKNGESVWAFRYGMTYFVYRYMNGEVIISNPVYDSANVHLPLIHRVDWSGLHVTTWFGYGKISTFLIFPDGQFQRLHGYKWRSLLQIASDMDALLESETFPVRYGEVALKLPSNPSYFPFEEEERAIWHELQAATTFTLEGWRCVFSTEKCLLYMMTATRNENGEAKESFDVFALPTLNGEWELTDFVKNQGIHVHSQSAVFVYSDRYHVITCSGFRVNNYVILTEGEVGKVVYSPQGGECPIVTE